MYVNFDDVDDKNQAENFDTIFYEIENENYEEKCDKTYFRYCLENYDYEKYDYIYDEKYNENLKLNIMRIRLES